MKRVVKMMSVFVAFLLIANVFAGCGKKAESVSETQEGSGSKITKDPLNLTIHMHYWNRIVFDDNWPVFKKAGEITNIFLKGTASKTATDSNQVFNVMMASGELPDIIHMSKDNANKYGAEGALIPLNDLIEKYAPNVQAFFKQHPEYKKHVTAPDGNIYFLSTMLDGEASFGYFIRKDWLDKLGLGVPKTVDEYYNVLKAFKEQDPNGNSKQDEVPFFSRDDGESIRIANLYGARTGWYIQDDQVHYGQYENTFKNAMINLVKWYKDGLIDQEIFTRGNKARDELLGSNLGGSTHDWFSSTAAYNDTLKDKVPGFQLIPIAPPADISGKVWEENSRMLLADDTVWGISDANKHPEETMKYFNFWFGEEGRRLMNFGIEGVHYTMVDGKPKFKDEILNGKEPALSLLNKDGAQINIGFQQDYEYEKQWTNELAKQGAQMYIDNKYLVPQFPSLSFTVDELKIIQEKWPAIDTFMKESRQKWILGAANPESDFEAYIQKLKDMGMNDIIKIYQGAYERYKKS